MSALVCTLFEGDYHYGVGALVNSLYRHGFRGEIVAGFRPPLPRWAGAALVENGSHRLEIGPGCFVRFVPTEVPVHFANYKPLFLLDLLERHPEATSIFYFDPDIVIKCPWGFFEEWTAGGIALCEDVNSPMPSSHPVRNAWRKLFAARHRPLARPMDLYANSGFIGLRRVERPFLEIWAAMLEDLKEKVPLEEFNHGNRPAPFCFPDQDALNAAMMATENPLSLVGRDGMDFVPGGYIMSHAIGPGKPWNKSPLFAAAQGIQPSLAEKAYLQCTDGPIRLYTAPKLLLRRMEMRLAAALGRVLKRAT